MQALPPPQPSPWPRRAVRGIGNGCRLIVPLNRISTVYLYHPVCESPSPPFRGEREGPAKREGEVDVSRASLSAPPTLPPPPGRRGGGYLNNDVPGNPPADFRKGSPRIPRTA